MSVSFDSNLLLTQNEQYLAARKKLVNLDTINSLANLLAREDLTVIHDPSAPTASFVPSTRVLTLPAWNNIPKIVYLLFTGHEIGHALFTPPDGFDHPLVRRDLLHTPYRNILNIAEDARIEKRTKRKYPGLRADFAEGYERLFKAGFFGVTFDELAGLNLVDRLNIRYKLGSLVADLIPFADGEESDFLDRGFSLETFEEAVVLANDLYDYLADTSNDSEDGESGESGESSEESSESSEESSSSSSSSEASEESSEDSGDSSDSGDESSEESASDNGNDESGDSNDAGSSGDETSDSDGDSSSGDAGDDSEDGDSFDDSEESVAAGGNEAGTSSDDFNDSIASITDEFSRSALESLVDTEGLKTRHLNIPFDRVDWEKAVHDTDRVLREWDENVSNNFSNNADLIGGFNGTLRNELASYLSRAKPVVSYLAKEFEMRKAADAHRRASVSRTGMINVGKLHAYQYEEDIFLRKTTMPDGKNHGMIMYLDLSGSMAGNIAGTIDQLINLVLFCKRVQIPFEVYGFNDNAGYAGDDRTSHSGLSVGDLVPAQCAYLRKFVSSDLKPAVFKRALEYLFFMREYWAEYSSRNADSWLGNHPGAKWLRPNERDYLGSTPLDDTLIYAHGIIDEFRRKTGVQICNFVVLSDGQSNRFDTWNGGSLRNNGNCSIGYDSDHHRESHWIYDEKTREVAETGWCGNSTALLLKSLKARHDLRVIGFYLLPATRRGRLEMNDLNGIVSDDVWEKFKKDGVHVSGAAGYDTHFVIKDGKNLKTSDDDMFGSVADNAKASQIRSAFKRGSKKKVSSRVLINSFVDVIA